MEDAISKQIEWEHSCVERGVARYRASLTKEKADGGLQRKTLDQLEPGRVIAEEVIGPLVARIEQEQLALVDPARNASGRMKFSDDQWILCAMDAEVLAATTVLCCLSGQDGVSDQTWTSAALRLGNQLKAEFDYIRWKESERVAEAERRKTDAAWAPNLYKLMKARNRVVDTRVFQKWSAKSSVFVSSDWSRQIRMRIGSTCMVYLIESNGWFECSIERVNAKNVRFFRLTELAKRWVAERHHQNELMRPMQLPMLCEPIDYSYQESNEDHH